MRKKERQQLICELVQQNQIETQEELVALLRERGVDVTQATISRDIQELNLLKISNDSGELHYHILTEREAPARTKVTRAVQSALLASDQLDKLVVLKTVPGNAHALGLVLESYFTQDLFTVLTDDDKVLMIYRNEEAAQFVHAEIAKIAI